MSTPTRHRDGLTSSVSIADLTWRGCAVGAVLACLCCSTLQISDYHFLPDTGKMAETLKSCLQESEEVPRDFTKLFDYSLHSLDMNALPDVLRWARAT